MSALFSDFLGSPSKPSRTQFNVRLPESISAALKIEADRQGISLNVLTERILTSHLQASQGVELRAWRPLERRYFACLRGTMGIYIIKCMKNGRIYVGQSVDVGERLKGHLKEIARARHMNEAIRVDAHLYGHRAFAFDLLERVTEASELNIRERYWYDSLGASVLRGNYNAAIPTDKIRPERTLKTRRRPGVHF